MYKCMAADMQGFLLPLHEDQRSKFHSMSTLSLFKNLHLHVGVCNSTKFTTCSQCPVCSLYNQFEQLIALYPFSAQIAQKRLDTENGVY